MKPGVPPKPAESLNDEDERGSGVRKIRRGEPASEEQQVGQYRVLERIGEGAMGYVYRAEHTLIGRVVAIKMLRAELCHDEACVRRFLAEARAVNLIKHPHIIDVTDYACTPAGQPWFVMEMLEGSDLLLAATREPLSLRRTLEIVRQLCEALAAVHAAGVVHRDVKPENIFLQQREGADFVTLLDFGIARLPDPVNADPLQEGLMGTSYYMAPEQASASPIDHRADLYAVGSTLFELVAGIGRTPFRAELLQQQLLHVMTTRPPRLSDRARVPAIVRRDLDLLVARLLAKEPSQRPSSASDVAGELARIAKKLEPRTRARRVAARPRSSSSAFWAIVLSALAATGAVWLATREAGWSQAARALKKAANDREHIVEPLRPAPETQVTPTAASPESSAALPAGKSGGAVDDSRKRGARPARRATQPKPHPEPEASPTTGPIVSEQPTLKIEPVAEPEPELPTADDEPSIDRDVVLNPFD